MRNINISIPSPILRWNIITSLIVINILVFIFERFIFPESLSKFLHLSFEGLMSGKIWELVTYQFSHGHFFHIFGNMLMLFFIGKNLIKCVSIKHFLSIYFIGGFFGGIIQLIYGKFVFGNEINLIGASASVMSILIALSTIIPNQKIYLLLFFIIPIKLSFKQLSMFVIFIDLMFLVLEIFSFSIPFASMAHIGGALFGYIYMIYYYPKLLNNNPKKSFFSIKSISDDINNKKINHSNQKPSINEDDINFILDKINETGFQSLTDKEKESLNKISEKLSKKDNNKFM